MNSFLQDIRCLQDLHCISGIDPIVEFINVITVENGDYWDHKQILKYCWKVENARQALNQYRNNLAKHFIEIQPLYDNLELHEAWAVLCGLNP